MTYNYLRVRVISANVGHRCRFTTRNVIKSSNEYHVKIYNIGDAVFHKYLHQQHYTPYLPRVDSSHGMHTDDLHRPPSFPAHSPATHLQSGVGKLIKFIVIRSIYMPYLQLRCNAMQRILWSSAPSMIVFPHYLFFISIFHNNECFLSMTRFQMNAVFDWIHHGKKVMLKKYFTDRIDTSPTTL